MLDFLTRAVTPGEFLATMFVAIILAIGGCALLYRRKSRKSGGDLTVIDENGSRPLGETDGGKLYAIVGGKNECPDCHGHGFYEGPSGGMSTNIFCMNRACRAGFNVTSFGGGHGTCERIGTGDIQRYPLPPVLTPVERDA